MENSTTGCWVWVDVETTGLDPQRDELLEVAVVITYFDLTERASFTSVVACEQAGEKCQANGILKMHQKSGLLAVVADEMLNGRRKLDVVQKNICDFLDEYLPPGKVGEMCGSTVSFDRSFLRQHMPAVEARFTHRHIDVSTINELARRWKPEVKKYAKELKRETHRALADIQDSIELLRFYRATGVVG